MDNDLEDEINRYLAKVAEQNPELLPVAMAQAMMLRTELMLMDCWRKAIEAYVNQVQGEFSKLVDSVEKGED